MTVDFVLIIIFIKKTLQSILLPFEIYMRKNILKTNSIEVKTYFKEIYPSEMLCVTFQYKHLNEHWKNKREKQ